MKKIFAYIAMFAAAATMVACENEPATITPDATGTPIEIAVGEIDRAVLDLTDGKTVTWEAGDQIGFYHQVGENVAVVNLPYTANGAGVSTTFEGNATWSGTAEDTHNVYVYYPYREDKCDNPKAIVKTLTNKQTYDVTGDWAEFGAKYCFAYGKAENVTPGSPVVISEMKQLFCVLRLTITNNSGADVNISKIVVESDKTNIRRPYTIDITQDVATTTGEGTKDITVTVQNGAVANGQSIDVRVAIGAEDYSGDTFTVTVTSDQGTHPAVTFAGKKLEQGERAAKAITLEAVPTSGYKIGDIVDGGVLFWIADDAKSGKVVAGPRADGANAMFCKDRTTTTGANDLDNGANNVATVKLVDPTLANHPAFKFCEDMGEGWYLPARWEIKSLVAAYFGFADYGEVPTDTNYSSAIIASRTYFDNQLKSLTNGVALDGVAKSGESVYSSNEKDATNAYYFLMSKRSASDQSGAKNSDKRTARCVKLVNL